MKAQLFPGIRQIHTYTPGDLLLAEDGLPTPLMPPSLTPAFFVAGPPADPADKDLLDIIKPAADDYPALSTTLQVLKFDPEDVVKYHKILGSVINFATGIAWGVGAVLTVASVLKTVFGDKEDATRKQLESISERVDQIYGYLAHAERQGLHREAVEWRGTLDKVRNAVNNARISRSPSNLDELVRLKGEIDGNLALMLDPGNGVISFQRAAYGYVPASSHWIDCCASPYMTLTDGTPLNYKDPAQELRSEIWDPGHYIDVLLNSLTDRLMLLATTEPAFRSTGYDLTQIKNLISKLGEFILRWQNAIIVADPVVGINGGRQLLNPLDRVPPGIVVGAVEPVVGVAFYEPYWAGFPVTTTWHGSILAKGQPDETKAADPAVALARAVDLQSQLTRGALAASGIGRLKELRARLQDLLAWTSVGSDFVNLPDPTFTLVDLQGPAPVMETVDLGFVGTYSKHPGRKYEGLRYTQTFEKHFRFDMPLRTDRSLIQLGYRMEIDGQNIPLTTYSVTPPEGHADRFPTQPVSVEVQHPEGTVYDVYQSDIFTSWDEDQFEGGDVIDPKEALALVHGWPFVKPERLFLNERQGPVAFTVDVSFSADLTSPDQPFVGHTDVIVRNLDPERCRDGAILDVRVYERRVIDESGGTDEFLADTMTIHLVPSFLVLGADYFDDRRDGMAAIDTIFGGANSKYLRQEQDHLPFHPEWQMRRQALEETAKLRALETFQREEPDTAAQVLSRFRLPDGGGGG
ncbi:hypothetical protein [Kitasatospora cinereorecta]|uniref:Uncharacterized protein n=1 Tax=Kitasatospora cinereorecta TaxID=285560 RepID=A0ABW0V4S8_9ACTN